MFAEALTRLPQRPDPTSVEEYAELSLIHI